MILSLNWHGGNAGETMTAQQWLLGADGAALIMAVVSGVAESRRNRRSSLDRHGWVPWRGLQIAMIFAMLALTILALKAG
jgi:hypothetical protein